MDVPTHAHTLMLHTLTHGYILTHTRTWTRSARSDKGAAPPVEAEERQALGDQVTQLLATRLRERARTEEWKREEERKNREIRERKEAMSGAGGRRLTMDLLLS